MAILEICKHPNPILRTRCEPVKIFGNGLHSLIKDMAETLYSTPGIGLAANQVGVCEQVIVIDLQRPDYQHGLIVLVNPQIVNVQGIVALEEGCLSVPGVSATIERYNLITVTAFDQRQYPIKIQTSHLLSVVIQHEMDHLIGKLFIDKI